MIPDPGAGHLSDEQLEHYRDGELAAGDMVHLKSCEECTGRLHEMDEAMAAYVEHPQMVQATHPMPPRPWASLDALIARDAESGRSKILRWWPRLAVAAAACAVVAALVWRQNVDHPAIRASELLARSASVARPRSHDIVFRLGGGTTGRILVRPAVLTTEATPQRNAAAEHLRSLFVAAHYSWRDPLSARSFQEWRSGLRQKRDSVSVIRQQGQESYLVRTDSAAGVLQSTSITLRAMDLYPTDASFAFAGEAALDVSDAPVPSTPEPVPATPGGQRELGKETPASPEDTLRVLAALDAIDADVEDPIEISEDSEHRHVMVRGRGVAPERRRLIADALKPPPRVIVQFGAGTSAASAPQTAPANSVQRTASDIPPDLRRQLEERFGGAVALQQTTDSVLDASASILARAHALETLASKFPPEIVREMPERDRALLRELQQHHAGELQRLFARMQGDLQPLLAAAKTPAQPAAEWQSTVPELMASARAVDDLLNHLLAGSYTQASGSEMLRKVSPAIDRLGSAIQAQGPK
jgi:hypothetical protein